MISLYAFGLELCNVALLLCARVGGSIHWRSQIIGILPFLSATASDAQRLDKFPWALGGYKNYPKVPNLDPTHRRFIAENAA